MFKNYNTFLSSASFKPARLVWASFLEGYKAAEKAKAGPGESGEKTKKGKETLRRQVEQDRYVNDKLKPYQKEVSDFIKSHRDRSGTIEERNKKFLLAVGGVEPVFIKRMQLVIFRRLNLTGDKRAVVDGKLGSYTLAALAKYLNIDLPEVTYQESNARTSETLELNPDVKKMLNTPKDQLFLEYQNALSNELDEFTDTLEINDEMTNLVGEPTELFYQKIEDIILRNHGKIDTSTVDGWRQAFKKAGLKNYEIEAMGLKAEAPSESEVPSSTGATTPEVSDSKPVEVISNSPRVAVHTEKVDKLAGPIIDLFEEEISKNILQGLVNEEQEALADVEEIKNDPYDWFNLIDDLTGPNEALTRYKTAYDNWKLASADRHDFAAQEKVKDERYAELKTVVTNYYLKLNRVVEIKKKEYNEKLIKIIQKYDFPEGMPVEKFKLVKISNHESVVEGPWDEVDTKYPPYFSEFMGNFLISGDGYNPPTSAIGSLEDLKPLIKGKEEGDEKSLNIKAIKDHIEAEGWDPVKAINSWIYYFNLQKFARENDGLLRDKNLELFKEMNDIRSLPESKLK